MCKCDIIRLILKLVLLYSVCQFCWNIIPMVAWAWHSLDLWWPCLADITILIIDLSYYLDYQQSHYRYHVLYSCNIWSSSSSSLSSSLSLCNHRYCISNHHHPHHHHHHRHHRQGENHHHHKYRHHHCHNQHHNHQHHIIDPNISLGVVVYRSTCINIILCCN